MILDLIEKIFMIILGVLVVVILFGIFSSLNKTSCEPTELYREEGISGFGGGIFDNMFDTVCTSILDINSGIWGVYVKFSVQLFGLRPTLMSISNALWGLGKVFCKTHSNAEYINRQGNDAITDPEVFKELFLFEAERCWNVFEGKNIDGLSKIDRNPIANIGYFECAEIIYEFPAGESLSLESLYERLYMDNTCGYHVNIPKHIPQEFDSERGEIQWCVQKDLLEDYWYDKDAKIGEYKNNACYFENKGSAESSSCLGMKNAMCSFGQIHGYSENSENIWLIEGIGKVSIYYYDHFYLPDEDREKAIMGALGLIAGIMTANPGLIVISTTSLIINDINSQRNEFRPNQLYVYYERYDLPDEVCSGTIDCEAGVSDCNYAYGCENKVFEWLSPCKSKTGFSTGSSCELIKTKAKCLSMFEAGCEWTGTGYCTTTNFNCAGCATDIGKGTSDCDKSAYCYEVWHGLNHDCESRGGIYDGVPTPCSYITSEIVCQRNACAGCSWVNTR